MSLFKKISLTVNGYNITLSNPIKLYKNDQLELNFEINEYQIVDGKRQKVSINPISAFLYIETPDNQDSIEASNIKSNMVTFYLSSRYTKYVGISRMQIILTDDDGCQISLPPFSFEVKENIYDEEVAINNVILKMEDDSILTDENGNIIKLN